MKKVGISTVFTGYNYGSVLQAYSTKYLLSKLGYEGIILKLNGSMVSGRDVRLKKLAVMTARTIIHPKNAKQNIRTYKTNISLKYSNKTINAFNLFETEHLKPCSLKWSDLKKEARSSEYVAFVCGSDQIWNADTYYVDPFYLTTVNL